MGDRLDPNLHLEHPVDAPPEPELTPRDRTPGRTLAVLALAAVAIVALAWLLGAVA